MLWGCLDADGGNATVEASVPPITPLSTWACSEKLVNSGQRQPLVTQLRVIWIIIRIRI